MTRAEEKSISWQMEHHPMALGGDAFAEEVQRWNINPAYVAGYEQAEKDLGWHSVDESLPPYGQEVIVLTNIANGHYLSTARRIAFAHRPDPKGWDGKDIATGEVKHYDPLLYDGWNIPGVKYWMPCPELEELKW